MAEYNHIGKPSNTYLIILINLNRQGWYKHIIRPFCSQFMTDRPIMASFFPSFFFFFFFLQLWPNHAQEYNQSDSGLVFLLSKRHAHVA